MKTLEQKRAEFAWKKVKGESEKYKNLVKSLPAMIMTNGLMQTLAFLEGKKEEHHKDALLHISEWLKEQDIVKSTNFSEVMEHLYKSSSQDYQRATEEALAILLWLRRLADAAIKS